MALPELDVARVQRWCAARVPEHARHQVRVECEIAPRHLTIVEPVALNHTMRLCVARFRSWNTPMSTNCDTM